MFLFLLTAVLLTAVYLYISSLDTGIDISPMSEIQAPDNSTGKPVPRLYGKARFYGNNIYYGNLTSIALEQDTGK